MKATRRYVPLVLIAFGFMHVLVAVQWRRSESSKADATHVAGLDSGSQRVPAGLRTITDLHVKDPVVVKYGQDEGLLCSVPGAVTH